MLFIIVVCCCYHRCTTIDSDRHRRPGLVLHGDDAAAGVLPNHLVVLPPAIAKGRLGREVARSRARRPAHEARLQLDVPVAAGIAGLAVDDDAPGRVEVDVGVAEEVDVVVAGAQPAHAQVAGEAVFDLFHHVDERRRL